MKLCKFPKVSGLTLSASPSQWRKVECEVKPVLTHLGSTLISMTTLASSFLLTKPISFSAFSPFTSTTGRGRESVSWNCENLCVCQKSGEEEAETTLWVSSSTVSECGRRRWCTLTSAAALVSSLTSKITALAPLSSAMRAWRTQNDTVSVFYNMINIINSLKASVYKKYPARISICILVHQH